MNTPRVKTIAALWAGPHHPPWNKHLYSTTAVQNININGSAPKEVCRVSVSDLSLPQRGCHTKNEVCSLPYTYWQKQKVSRTHPTMDKLRSKSHSCFCILSQHRSLPSLNQVHPMSFRSPIPSATLGFDKRRNSSSTKP
jgi:hypothetical protein